MQRRFVASAAMLGLFLSSTLVLAAPEKPGYLGVMASKAEEGKTGAWLRAVTPDSPAAKAGLQNGDIVTKVGDTEVKDAQGLTAAIAGHKAGDKLTLWVLRDGKEQKIETTLGERPARKLPQLGNAAPAAKSAYLGVHTQEMSPELKQRLGLAVDKGAMVTDVMAETPAAKAGLKAEDVIVAVGDKDIANPQELKEAIASAKIGGEVVLKVMRGKDKIECRCILAEAPVAFDFGSLPENLPEFLKDPNRSGHLPFKFDFKDGQLPFDLKNLPEMKNFTFDLGKVADMQKKIDELEKRIAELEKQLKK